VCVGAALSVVSQKFGLDGGADRTGELHGVPALAQPFACQLPRSSCSEKFGQCGVTIVDKDLFEDWCQEKS
jgi:hypothetical protein